MNKVKSLVKILLSYIALGTIVVNCIVLTKDLLKFYTFVRESGRIMIFLDPILFLGVAGIGFSIHMASQVIKNIIR